jgi:hypothetical protein
MLNYLQSDIRKLLDLVRRMENFDATIAASQAASKAIQPEQTALDERKRMEREALHLREKWAI